MNSDNLRTPAADSNPSPALNALESARQAYLKAFLDQIDADHPSYDEVMEDVKATLNALKQIVILKYASK